MRDGFDRRTILGFALELASWLRTPRRRKYSTARWSRCGLAPIKWRGIVSAGGKFFELCGADETCARVVLDRAVSH